MILLKLGVVSGPAIKDFLADNLSEFNANQIDGVVLGCTHYPFVRNSIQEFFPNANFYDGFLGGNQDAQAQTQRRQP